MATPELESLGKEKTSRPVLPETFVLRSVGPPVYSPALAPGKVGLYFEGSVFRPALQRVPRLHHSQSMRQVAWGFISQPPALFPAPPVSVPRFVYSACGFLSGLRLFILRSIGPAC